MINKRIWGIALLGALTLHLTLAALVMQAPEPYRNAATAPLMVDLTMALSLSSPSSPPTAEHGPAKPSPHPVLEQPQLAEPEPISAPEPLPEPPRQPETTIKPAARSETPGQADPQPETMTRQEPAESTPESVVPEITDKTRLKPAPLAGPTLAAQERATQHWHQTLAAHLQRYKKYPGAARVRHITGTVGLKFEISRRGQLLDFAIQQSSGNPLLDRAAVDMVERANPYPLPPAHLPASALSLQVPVRFTLN